MRLATLSHTLVDSVLARPILDAKGMVLLGEGVKLTERLIDRLRTMEVYSVYINDPLTDEIIVEDTISDQTRQMAIETVHKSVEDLKLQAENSRFTSRQQLGREFGKVLQEILGDVQNNKNAMVSLASIYTTDGYLYHHSLKVSVLAVVMGLAKGYNHSQLIDLGIGALLHDIGMLQLPSSIVEQESTYSPEEFELMKQHTIWGYDYLKEQDGISTLSAHVALQHHERLDGSGYPRGLRGNDIHEYAQIVSICDVFDAMNSKRHYRSAYLPHEVMEYLMASSTTLFDRSLVTLFLKNVAIYQIGMTLLLSNGQTAVVVGLNPEYPQRPIVRPIKDSDSNPLKATSDIDLTEHTTLMITGLQ